MRAVLCRAIENRDINTQTKTQGTNPITEASRCCDCVRQWLWIWPNGHMKRPAFRQSARRLVSASDVAEVSLAPQIPGPHCCIVGICPQSCVGLNEPTVKGPGCKASPIRTGPKKVSCIKVFRAHCPRQAVELEEQSPAQNSSKQNKYCTLQRIGASMLECRTRARQIGHQIQHCGRQLLRTSVAVTQEKTQSHPKSHQHGGTGKRPPKDEPRGNGGQAPTVTVRHRFLCGRASPCQHSLQPQRAGQRRHS